MLLIKYQDKKVLIPYEEMHTEFITVNLVLAVCVLKKSMYFSDSEAMYFNDNFLFIYM